jgi:hypothetical protein
MMTPVVVCKSCLDFYGEIVLLFVELRVVLDLSLSGFRSPLMSS